MDKICVEMVIPQLAEKGGLDRIINEFADYLLLKDNMELQLVQLVDTGLIWWNDACSVTNLYQASENPSFMDTADAYAKHLESVAEKPDVILATGWPVTITIVREALRRTGLEPILIGYPHMTFREGQEHGVGGIQCIAEADAVFVISKQVEDEILQSGIATRVFRENDGIQFPSKPLDRNEFPKNRKLLFVGRLVEYKNLPMVFRAIANTKEKWSLRVVGQGEDEKTKQAAADCGVLGQVEFCGFSHEPYANTDDVAFCVVSSNYEGFCLVIPEALSRGIPVISTPVGCATEVIKPGENGYLVNVNDNQMLTEILDMISEEKLPLPSAKACRKSVMEYELNHTFEKMYQDLKKLYAEKFEWY